MKVLFVVRPDFLSNSGGDNTQVLDTKMELEKLGVDIELATNLDGRLNGIDVVHVFNMNPSDFALSCLQNAARKHVPTTLSPIYWSPMEFILRGMQGSYAKRWYDAMSRALPLPRHLPTAIRDAIVSPSGPRIEEKINGFERKRQEMSLRLADVVLPNSNAESGHLRSIFGVQADKMQVVYNGVQPDRLRGNHESLSSIFEPEGFVLYAGRIEARKNTLTLIRACNELGLRLVVIGRVAEGAPAAKYGNVCLAEGKQGSVTFLNELPKESEVLYSAYRSARVYALPSWYETPGLSSLEAAACGCNIVVTTRGSTREYFEDFAWYCNPASKESVRNAIASAYVHPHSGELQARVISKFTWRNSALATIKSYESVLSEAKRR